jgi:hypothetical protein
LFFSVVPSSSSSNANAALQPENIAMLAVENLQRQRDPQALANMSRRRFVFTQLNSLIIAVLTCLSICIFTLARVENVNEFMFGQCGILTQILKNLTGLNLAVNDSDLCSQQPQQQQQQPNSSEL